ncbi:MAG: hypothetical protein WCZ66_03935 [Sphingomonadaceae bacterium]
MASQPGNDFQMNRPTIISLLYIGYFLAGISAIIGVILAYVWQGEPHEDWENSHYRFLIRTFWIGVVYSVIAAILSVLTFFLLSPLFALVAIWFAVRAIKVLLAAQRREPLTNVETWLF